MVSNALYVTVRRGYIPVMMLRPGMFLYDPDADIEYAVRDIQYATPTVQLALFVNPFHPVFCSADLKIMTMKGILPASELTVGTHVRTVSGYRQVSAIHILEANSTMAKIITMNGEPVIVNGIYTLME